MVRHSSSFHGVASPFAGAAHDPGLLGFPSSTPCRVAFGDGCFASCSLTPWLPARDDQSIWPGGCQAQRSGWGREWELATQPASAASLPFGLASVTHQEEAVQMGPLFVDRVLSCQASLSMDHISVRMHGMSQQASRVPAPIPFLLRH